MAQQQKQKRKSAARPKSAPVFARITLRNGEQFEVIENFATVLRHQRDALSEDEPNITMTGPTGTRVAMDPLEIISVHEIIKPTRNYSRNGKSDEGAQKTTAKDGKPTRRQQRQTRRPPVPVA